MHQRVQKRKLKHILKQLLLPALLFGLTFIICAVIFHPWAQKKVLVPLSVATTSVPLPDSAESKIRDFCNNQHLACIISTPDGTSIEMQLKNNETILLSSQKNIASQLSSLQLTMNQLTIEGKQFKKLDFRFDTVVITF